MELEWVKKIKDVPLYKKYAQFKEEAIIDYIFSNIGIRHKELVDFGAGGLGCEMSNSKHLLENGWSGLRMDGNPNGDDTIKKEIITAENIVELFKKYNVKEDFDFLSIDIDGNDYWVLKALLWAGYTPSVIINEFNGCLSPSESIAIKNNPNHVWANNDYYGASFLAFKNLLNNFGYTLVHQVACTNMIFVRQDMVPQFDYGITYTQTQYHAHFKEGEWQTV